MRARHCIPVIGWIIAYVEWIQAWRICNRSGAIPFSKEWENTFKAYETTAMAFGVTAGFLILCIVALKLLPLTK